MDNSPAERGAFHNTFSGLADYYGKPALSSTVIQIYYDSLAAYSMEQVSFALSRHVASRDESGKYMPKVADILQHINGKKPSTSEVVAQARLASTPFGVLARLRIGTHDLNNMDAFYLADRANEVLQLFDEWQARADRGQYTNHEITIMLKHNVNPTDAFLPGLAPPANAALARITNQAESVAQSDTHKFMLQKIEPVQIDKQAGFHPRVAEIIEKMLADVEPETDEK